MNTKPLFYPVSKVLVQDILPGFQTNVQKSYAIVTEVEGSKKILGLCSPGYELVPNEKVITYARQLLKREGFETSVSFRSYDDAKFFIDFTLKNEKFHFNLGTKKDPDMLVPKLRLVNSYDGSIKYNASATILRLICTNGMVAPFTLKSFRKRHTKQLEGDKSVQFAIEVIHRMLEETDELLEPYFQLLDSKVVDVEDRVEEVIEATEFPKTLAENVISRVEEEFKFLNSTRYNDWLVYNGFNYELNHNFEDSSLKDHKRDALDQRVLTYLLEN